MKKKISISVVIPFRNEENNLKILIPLILTEIKKNKKFKINLVLVNDKSTDNSLEVCKKFNTKYKKVLKIKNLKKRGFQTGALKCGIDTTNSDFIILMDADLQDDPAKIKFFLKKIKEKNELVVGVRVKRKAALILKLGLKIYDYIFYKVLNRKILTYRAQYAAYESKFIKNIKMIKNDHRYLIPIAVTRGAKKISMIKLNLKERKFGKSNYNQYLKSVFGVFEVFKFIYRLKKGYYN